MQDRIKYLFQQYLDNDVTPEEFDELFAAIGDGQAMKPIEESLDKHLDPRPRKRHARLAITVSVAAAVIIIVSAASVWLMTSQSKNPLDHSRNALAKNTVTRSTQRSEFKYMLLPDSTQVWLNAASTLEFPKSFNAKTREVYLKGEAYFDVRHADRVPFVIYTGHVSTQVLGTAFNIKAYPDLENITVSVQKGKVKVKYEDEDVAVLVKGQQATIGNRDKKVHEAPIKSGQSAPWHEGNLAYDDYTIQDIVNDLERVYDITIVLASPDIANMRVSTTFKRAMGAETALDILCRLSDAHLKQDKGTYIIESTK